MRIFALMMSVLFALPVAAADKTEEREVVATVQKLFDAMAAKDSEAVKAVMLPDGRMASVRDAGAVRFGVPEDFAVRLAGMKGAVLERMWNPTVMIQGRIAQVWAEYDFWSAGKFSHCGIDSVSLLKTDSGWKIAGIAYTMETTGCKPSPLGVPAGADK